MISLNHAIYLNYAIHMCGDSLTALYLFSLILEIRIKKVYLFDKYVIQLSELCDLDNIVAIITTSIHVNL